MHLSIEDLPSPTLARIREGLERVTERFERELRSDLPCVDDLCAQVERYRGKMLRPTLVFACGLATGRMDVTEAHVVSATVVEMVHMATLVHDDVLDEAETRRGGRTLNRLRGNEAAVILGDYLIASAFRLCSTLEDRRVALLVGETSRTLCAGELLQLHRRGDASLDEAAYFAIIERKTASLIGLSCRLGGMASGAGEETCGLLEEAGRRLGSAFQIQDDVLDLTGRESVLGKPVGRDLAMGKLTLPLIRHLASLRGLDRGEALALLETPGAREQITSRLAGDIEHVRGLARELAAEAAGLIERLPDSPGKGLLGAMARVVVERSA